MSYLLSQELADAPCSCSAGLSGIINALIPSEVEYFFGALFNNYLNTVAGVYDRVSWNACPTNWLGMPLDCIPYKVVKDVLDCYVSLQSKQKIPEYNPWEKTAKDIEKSVSLCAGTQENTVRWVLYELFYGTADGTLKFGGATLRPAAYKAYEPDRDPPNEIEELINDILAAGKWLLLITAVGFGSFYAYQWWNATTVARNG